MRKLLVPVMLLALVGLVVIGCTKKEAAKAPVAKAKIGLCFDVGGKGDKSFNDSAFAGFTKLAKDFKGNVKDDPANINFGTEVDLKYMSPKEGGQDREQIARVLAEEGYNPIYCVGFLYQDSVAKLAKDFPKTQWILIDGYLADLTETSNVTCLSFAEHEGSFLIGAMVGLMVKDQKIGFLGGMDIPLIHKFQGGFYAGAMYTNPALRDAKKLLGQYAGKDPTAFNDPKTGESIAQAFYKQGAEIVYHASGGTGNGLFKAARDAKKYAIGVDSDQGLIYATSTNAEEQEIGKWILTSMLKRVDNAVYLTGKEFIEKGKVAGGYRTFGLANDGVGVAVNDYNKDKLAPYTAKLDEIKAKIVSGEITVPDDDAKVKDWAAKTFK
jgi:basic membrane protein A and related proteins